MRRPLGALQGCDTSSASGPLEWDQQSSGQGSACSQGPGMLSRPSCIPAQSRRSLTVASMETAQCACSDGDRRGRKAEGWRASQSKTRAVFLAAKVPGWALGAEGVLCMDTRRGLPSRGGDRAQPHSVPRLGHGQALVLGRTKPHSLGRAGRTGQVPRSTWCRHWEAQTCRWCCPRWGSVS